MTSMDSITIPVQRASVGGYRFKDLAIHPKERFRIQTKLRIGQPHDKYEQEADRVAEQVMRMPEPQVQRQVTPEPEEEEEGKVQTKPVASQIFPLIQRQIKPEQEEEEETLQTKLPSSPINSMVQRQIEPEEEEEETLQTKTTISDHHPTMSSSFQSQITALQGGGQPLPQSERTFFEPRFGADFSTVRIHSDSSAAETARALNARAFTTGNNIAFDQGQYMPGTAKGRQLLAHELTHVVQQAGVSNFSVPQMTMGSLSRKHIAETNTIEQLAPPESRNFQDGPKQSFDVLSETSDINGGAIDQINQKLDIPIVQRVNGGGAGPARPTNLIQILTSWAPGANRYGFQLRFRCRSTSGRVRDLQSQADLGWRERVTYTRNDFAHRITPSNPTILPPNPRGISFATNTTRRGRNLLEFDNATDTHWMPTSAVRENDFVPTGPRPLPAIMESRQLYQYTPDGGTSWRYFAGGFIIRRTLFRRGGRLRFRTNKVRIHSTTENYKP
jgi:hypothetical protein